MAFFIERMSAPLEEYSVAADNGRVVGFSRWEGDGIAQVFVLPAYHGTGVAALVLRAAEGALLAQGHTRIWLQCRKGNDRARRFYEKHGWIVVADVDHDMGHMDGRSPVIVWRLEKSLV
jgi:GNAT superfamily N-acetyltransferase